jgi:hypothetical protein
VVTSPCTDGVDDYRLGLEMSFVVVFLEQFDYWRFGMGIFQACDQFDIDAIRPMLGIEVGIGVMIFEPSAGSLIVFENLESRFSVEASSHASRLLSRGQESLKFAF